MKNIKTILYLTTLCTLSAIPQSYAEEEHHHNHGKKHANQQKHELSLNHGAKWQMDEHTRKMFQVMAQRTETNETPKALGELLNEDLQKLIKGCTMTGKAHDQLHLFLTPFIPAVKSLAETGSTKALEEVTLALHNYADYFR